MKAETFLEFLGRLDDEIVEGANTPMKKTKKWGWLAAAACLVLAVTAGFFWLRTPSGPNAEQPDVSTSCTADVDVMVFVNGILYRLDPGAVSFDAPLDEFVYLGTIHSRADRPETSGDGIPREEFQANYDAVGCEVYQYGENIILLEEGTYRLFVPVRDTAVNWEELSEEERMQRDPTYMGS